MQLIRNMLRYVMNLLMCLSSLGQLHIVHLTMPLTLLMKMHRHHAIRSTNLALTNLMLCRSTLTKCWKRAGYIPACGPMVRRSCLYARKQEISVSVLTFAVSTVRAGFTCSQCHIFITYQINWVNHVYFLLLPCCLRTTRCISRRDVNITLLFSR